MKKLLQWTIVFFSVITSQAQKSYPDTLYAYFTDEKIALDGELTEGCWKEAMRISNFTQRELYEGEPATEKTGAAIVYNTNVMDSGIWW